MSNFFAIGHGLVRTNKSLKPRPLRGLGAMWQSCTSRQGRLRPGLAQALDLLMARMPPSEHNRLVAGIVVCTHIAAVLYLAEKQGEPEPNLPEDALQVHWIKRSQAPSRDEQTLQEDAARAAPPARNVQHATTPQAENATAEQTEDPLNLTLPPVDTVATFERGPLWRAETIEATPNRMQLKIVDQSFGAKLQRMAKAQACKELRSALGRSPSQTTVIISTMKEEGCMKS